MEEGMDCWATLDYAPAGWYTECGLHEGRRAWVGPFKTQDNALSYRVQNSINHFAYDLRHIKESEMEARKLDEVITEQSLLRAEALVAEMRKQATHGVQHSVQTQPMQQSSVEIAQNSKGTPQVTVKIYDADPDAAKDMALRLYKEILLDLAL
jgi:hypothetical protein